MNMVARYLETSADPVTEELALLLATDYNRVSDIIYSIDEWDIDARRLCSGSIWRWRGSSKTAVMPMLGVSFSGAPRPVR
jgi:hypothetical protein